MHPRWRMGLVLLSERHVGADRWGVVMQQPHIFRKKNFRKEDSVKGVPKDGVTPLLQRIPL
jgi:hypothetical protein